MPLRFLLDEDLRGGGLWQAIQQHNALGVDCLDAVRVGDLPDLPLGLTDLEVIVWAERENRIIISRDKNSLVGELADHLQAGSHSAGVFLVRSRRKVEEVLSFLILVAHAGEPGDFQDRFEFIPW